MDLDWILRAVKLSVFTIGIVIFFILQRILCLISPSLQKKIVWAYHTPMRKTTYDPGDFYEAFAWLSNIPHLWRVVYYNCMFQAAGKNWQAPNPKVLTSDGKKEVNLLDPMKPGRPLILNFGSCT